MKKSTVAISALVFGTLALSPAAGWSQTSSDMPGYNSSSGSSSMGKSATYGQWSREDVKSVQEALKDKGHNPGPIDGVMGPQTQQALRNFQRAQNIQQTGQLDSSTASALGVTLSSNSSMGNSSKGMGSSNSSSGMGSSNSSSGMSSGSSSTGSNSMGNKNPSTSGSSSGSPSSSTPNGPMSNGSAAGE
jgi:peptidoglycan hydrolase-like protein with peptidoglycan-binding domain